MIKIMIVNGQYSIWTDKKATFRCHFPETPVKYPTGYTQAEIDDKNH
jgi:hypothetical protein